MTTDLESLRENSSKIQQLLQHQCMLSAGGVDTRLLCSSLSMIEPRQVVTNGPADTLDRVMKHLHYDRVGCVTIVSDEGKILGIFSERDYIIKVYGNDVDHSDPIEEFMTPEPLCVTEEDTIAYALTLMSQGGFRHLPIVDKEERPTAILSVKCIVDFLSKKVFDDLQEG